LSPQKTGRNDRAGNEGVRGEATQFAFNFGSRNGGDSASLNEETATWPEGIKDARRCTGSKGYSGPQNCKTPKYWDYLIYANMILICSGTDLATAQIRCNDLLTVLDPQDDAA